MKKFTIHLDATIAVLVVFILSFGFNFYQRYQYQDLLDEYLKQNMGSLGNEFSTAFMQVSLEKCEKKLNELEGASDTGEQTE